MKMLVLSDVHANWAALEAVTRAEGAWDELVFCGDAVDDGPHPVECVRWLRANAGHAIRGNHDNALAFDRDCHCMGRTARTRSPPALGTGPCSAVATSISSRTCSRWTRSSGAARTSARPTRRPPAGCSSTSRRTGGATWLRASRRTSCCWGTRTSRACGRSAG